MKGIENDSQDILVVSEFKALFMKFQDYIDRAVQQQLEFWSELCSDQPDIQKLINFGSILTREFENIHSQYDELCSYNLNNSTHMELYAAFLGDIIHDENEQKKINEQIDMLVKNKGTIQELEEQKLDNLKDITSSIMITISAAKENLGIMRSAGSEVFKTLGYKPAEIVGENVGMLMPPHIAKVHDSYITRFMETGEEHIIGKRTNVHTIDRQGFLHLNILELKVIPNFSEVLSTNSGHTDSRYAVRRGPSHCVQPHVLGARRPLCASSHL